VSDVVIEGLEEVISKDLAKHKLVLERLAIEVQTFKAARAHEIKRKRHYAGLVGGGKFNDVSLRASIDQINVNVRHLSDKVEMGEEQIAFNTRIVDTLTKQLATQNAGLVRLAEYRRTHGS
jgi:uncharacterized 2Fe-2S/4Fe-4S cluster protein (DUF4445 family)